MSYFLTKEAIFEMGENYATADDNKLKILLSQALMYAPAEAVEHALKHCLFICLVDEGVFFPSTLIDARNVIIFPANIHTQSTDDQIQTILHEVAHSFLDHHSMAEPDLDMIEDEYYEQESDAWTLVKRWLERSDYKKESKVRRKPESGRR